MMRNTAQRWVSLLLAGLLIFGSVASFAQDDDAEDKKNTVMSERAYKRLSQAHEAMGAEDYAGAITKLQAMEEMKLSDYERALVLQTYGFIYAQQERYTEALDYFERCIALDALPLKAQQGMLYSLAGLYANEQQWLKAVETIERWLVAEPDPPADAYILIASSYAELKRYRDALPWIEKAIASTNEPKESWYQLMVAIYFELNEYRNAARAARIMVSLWPEKKNYWEMLQGAYQEIGDDFAAMSALELGYNQGVLTDEANIVNLARMKMYLEVPYASAELLSKEMEAGRVQRNKKNLELLLASWEAAREFESAVKIIDELAANSGDGKLYVRKAQAFSERNRWEDVVVASDQALGRGGLSTKDEGTTLLLKGVALLELDQHKPAQAAFERAVKVGGRSAEQARSWIQYLKDQAGTLSAGAPAAAGDSTGN
ncbi:MAG: tetratricopeptide repeat protein [Gammaproteobacteria bacterium]